MTARFNRGLPCTLVAFAFTCVAASQVEAHIDLNYPLGGNLNQKVGPCGDGDFDSGEVATLLPGSQLSIQIKETIPHPGHMRVLFDADTTDGLDFPPQASCDEMLDVDGISVLADGLLPQAGPVGSSCYQFHLDLPGDRVSPNGTNDYVMDVTLPNMECENCAIQVTQVMTDIGKQVAGEWSPTGGLGIYFRCARVVLSNDAPANPNPGNPDPGNPGPEGEETGEEMGDGMPPVAVGGCSTGGSSGVGGLGLLFGLALLGLSLLEKKRGRRRQPE